MTSTFKGGRTTPLVALAIALGLTAAARASAQGSSEMEPMRKGLAGTWRVQVTIVDCNTGAERPPFWSLVTFARGGTVTDTTANQSFPGPRTPGHGVWSRTGPHTYHAATDAFILFGPTLRPWVHRIEQDIEMTAEDAFSSHANVEFSLAPGSQPPPPVPLPPTPICANALGYRY